MLKKHFRGYREIISYSSKYFYDDSLQAIKIRAKPIDQVIKFTFVTHDDRIEIIENSNQLEIDSIISEIDRISIQEPNSSIGIITPHTNQQKLLVDALLKHQNGEHLQKQHKIKIMTFDTCQGEERDIVIYSMVANPMSDKLWGVFIKDRKSVDLEEGGQIKLQRLNVGFSRAKEQMHFFLSKPLEEYSGSIGEALRHYNKICQDAKNLPDSNDTDPRSPMEKKVLHWIKETAFFKNNQSSIELHTQFPLGDYIKQLDKRYKHPSYVTDFLFVYTDEERKEHKLIIEYDGFETHFQNSSLINEFNYEQYYTEQHIYREKVLESYGYNFLRINRFNIGKDPIETLSIRFEKIIKKNFKVANSIIATIQNNISDLQNGSIKECTKCKEIKSLNNFMDMKLVNGYGRYCNSCKGTKSSRSYLSTDQVFNLHNHAEVQKIKCPLCSSEMSLRKRRSDNQKFYGCTKYPACKGTRDYTKKSLTIDDIIEIIEVQKSNMAGKEAFLDYEGNPCSTEIIAKKYLEKNNYKVIRAEVSFWQAMFCLAFWEEIFVGMEDPTPMNDIPRDLFLGDEFYMKRKLIIDDKFEYLKECNIFNFINGQIKKYGSYNTRLLQDGIRDNISFFNTSDVQEFLQKIDAKIFADIVYRIAQNPNSNRAGTPDFIAWKDLKLEMIEVKKEHETIRSSQVNWIKWFLKNNIPIKIIRVKAI